MNPVYKTKGSGPHLKAAANFARLKAALGAHASPMGPNSAGKTSKNPNPIYRTKGHGRPPMPPPTGHMNTMEDMGA